MEFFSVEVHPAKFLFPAQDLVKGITASFLIYSLTPEDMRGVHDSLLLGAS